MKTTPKCICPFLEPDLCVTHEGIVVPCNDHVDILDCTPESNVHVFRLHLQFEYSDPPCPRTNLESRAVQRRTVSVWTVTSMQSTTTIAPPRRAAVTFDEKSTGKSVKLVSCCLGPFPSLLSCSWKRETHVLLIVTPRSCTSILVSVGRASPACFAD